MRTSNLEGKLAPHHTGLSLIPFSYMWANQVAYSMLSMHPSGHNKDTKEYHLHCHMKLSNLSYYRAGYSFSSCNI